MDKITFCGVVMKFMGKPYENDLSNLRKEVLTEINRLYERDERLKLLEATIQPPRDYQHDEEPYN